MGEGKGATLRIEVPENARKAVTTIGFDPRHPLSGGLEVADFGGELSLGRGEVSQQPRGGGTMVGIRCEEQQFYARKHRLLLML